MKRIIAPIDFHGASEAVVAYAGQLALALELPLELLHVDEVIGMAAFESINRTERAAIEQQLRDLMTWSVPNEVTCAVRMESVTGQHTVAEGIIDACQGAALLVIGQTESRGLWHWFDGDTTAVLLDGVTCPVLVVPPKSTWEAPRSILLAVDARPLHPDAAAMVANVARAFDASVDVFIDATEKAAETQRRELNLELGGMPHSYTVASATGHVHLGDYLLSRATGADRQWLSLRHSARANWQREAHHDMGTHLAEAATVPTLVLIDALPQKDRVRSAGGIVAERHPERMAGLRPRI